MNYYWSKTSLQSSSSLSSLLPSLSLPPFLSLNVNHQNKEFLVIWNYIHITLHYTYGTTARTKRYTASNGSVVFNGRKNSIPWHAASNSMPRTMINIT